MEKVHVYTCFPCSWRLHCKQRLHFIQKYIKGKLHTAHTCVQSKRNKIANSVTFFKSKGLYTAVCTTPLKDNFGYFQPGPFFPLFAITVIDSAKKFNRWLSGLMQLHFACSAVGPIRRIKTHPSNKITITEESDLALTDFQLSISSIGYVISTSASLGPLMLRSLHAVYSVKTSCCRGLSKSNNKQRMFLQTVISATWVTDSGSVTTQALKTAVNPLVNSPWYSVLLISELLIGMTSYTYTNTT